MSTVYMENHWTSVGGNWIECKFSEMWYHSHYVGIQANTDIKPPALIVKTNKLFALYSYNYWVRKCSYNDLSAIVSYMEKVYIKWTINYLS